MIEWHEDRHCQVCIIVLEGVWYMHLKTKNMCLKTCVEIRVCEKVCGHTCNVV